MRVFDPHIHMTSRTTDDYRAMYDAGVRAVTEPSFWLGQPRTGVASFTDYFDTLVGWERFRAARFGIAHHCTIALNPKEANDPRCAGVLDVLPRYLAKDGVVAVGETGFDAMTDEEEKVFRRHLALAAEHDLPVLVHTPHRDKAAGTRRSLELVEESGLPPERVLIDHLNELTVGLVAGTGCWMGFSVYPDTKMDEHRVVRVFAEYGLDRMVVNSAADWGHSDPLKTVKTGRAMREAGFTEADAERVLWDNPVAFYGQSGRLLLDQAAPEPADPAETWAGNSVLRGARPDA
jgi:predicted metal-dependent TIM-barrel fold hydrolase